MLPVHSLLHELRQSVPYLVAFLALLVLLVKRDRDAVRLMGYATQPRYQRLQDSWHALGYAAVALVGGMLAYGRHGVTWPALLFAGVLSVSWWIGFDALLNVELGKGSTFYVGKTARIDRAARNLAAWLSRQLRRAHQLGQLQRWPGLAAARVPPELLLATAKVLAFAVAAAGYVLVLRFP